MERSAALLDVGTHSSRRLTSAGCGLIQPSPRYALAKYSLDQPMCPTSVLMLHAFSPSPIASTRPSASAGSAPMSQSAHRFAGMGFAEGSPTRAQSSRCTSQNCEPQTVNRELTSPSRRPAAPHRAPHQSSCAPHLGNPCRSSRIGSPPSADLARILLIAGATRQRAEVAPHARGIFTNRKSRKSTARSYHLNAGKRESPRDRRSGRKHSSGARISCICTRRMQQWVK